MNLTALTVLAALVGSHDDLDPKNSEAISGTGLSFPPSLEIDQNPNSLQLLLARLKSENEQSTYLIASLTNFRVFEEK